jgi:peroxiredoxin
MKFRVARACLSLVAVIGLWVDAALAQHDIRPWSARIASPPVQWTDTTGRSWGREQLQGKAVVINFWATWCVPCLEELPSLQTLSDFSQGADVQVLTVNVKDPISRVQSFMARNAFTFAVVSDRQGDIAKQWGVKVFPTTVLVSPQGHALWRVEGAVDWSGQEASSWIRRLHETSQLRPSNPATPGRPRS